MARAIIEEGHRHNLRVMAHINTADDTKTLVRAQLDGITHIARDPYDDETLELMKRQGTILAPTLVQRRKALIFSEDEQLLNDPFVRAVLGLITGFADVFNHHSEQTQPHTSAELRVTLWASHAKPRLCLIGLRAI
ncbi:hypothetical protein MYX82_03315 [Acidobacteria bacterium AH-259-D05]|nr:hypothetical protein [Acidobacteria bacterium AH-259-D05]